MEDRNRIYRRLVRVSSRIGRRLRDSTRQLLRPLSRILMLHYRCNTLTIRRDIEADVSCL